MAPELRRRSLIAAAVPLVSRHGCAVTTAQVAQAAGVAEGTLFRLFADKTSLLDAVLREALDPSEALAELCALPSDERVEHQISAAATAICLHFQRALPVMHGALRQGTAAHASRSVAAMFERLLGALEALLQTEIARGRLSGDARTLASMLVGLCQANTWQRFFAGDVHLGVSPRLLGTRGAPRGRQPMRTTC